MKGCVEDKARDWLEHGKEAEHKPTLKSSQLLRIHLNSILDSGREKHTHTQKVKNTVYMLADKCTIRCTLSVQQQKA